MKNLNAELGRLTPEKRALLELRRKKRSEGGTRIAPVSRTETLPLSFAQQRLWFLDRLEGESAVYNVPMSMRVRGALEVSTLERALGEITRRHEPLRTTYAMHEGQAVQKISEPKPFDLPLIEVNSETEANRRLHEEAHQHFDLQSGPLFRAKLLRLASDDHILFFSMHHILTDGWSAGVLLRELSAIYTAYAQNKPSPLPELAIQYADWAVWQRQHVAGALYEEQVAHWRKVLAGAPAVLELGHDRARPPVQRFDGRTYHFELDRALSAKIGLLSRELGATLYMTLLSAFSVLLGRRSGQDDVLVGTPIANRTMSETEPLIGIFINTLVMRTRPSPEKSFKALVDEVKKTALDAYANQDLPFEGLIERLQPVRSLSHSPLFQVMFILQNARRGPLSIPGLDVTSLPRETDTAKFDLTLIVEEHDGVLAASFEYNVDLFYPATIKRLAASFETLLASIVADPNAKNGDLAILPESERAKLLYEFNDTTRAYDQDATLVSMFAAQAKQTPDRIAAQFERQTLTYRELDRRANGLAHRLRALGVRGNVPVGVWLERGLDLLIALFGVMKAGAAYVPLDPAFPQARLDAMIEDSAMTAIVGRTVMIDDAVADGPPDEGARSDELAYVLYTSGSTGRPKGVEVRHRSLINFLMSMKRAPGITAEDVLVAVTTISFDIAGLELYLPLISGAKVVLASKDAAAGKALLALLERSRATILQATPTTWRLLFRAAPDVRLPALTALVGGEALPAELAKELVLRTRRAFNMYRPTETTIWSTIAPLSAGDSSGGSSGDSTAVSIGRPIANTQLLVTDAKMRLVPIGVPGELLIGGHGVARGYRGRPDLTHEKFVPSPFPVLDATETRLYRTGDRVRLREDGSLEFLGRLDHQVKLRGFRIELGEIESVLGMHEEIKEAAALLLEDRLVAYVVPKKALPATQVLRAHLAQKLPDYMIPAAFVALEELPLTPNGKIDRRALPSPDAAVMQVDRGLVAPRTPLEARLVEIFRETLRVERIGVHESFFELGGHSLLAVTLIDRIEKVFEKTLPVMALFRAPSIAELAPLLDTPLEEPPASRALEELRVEGDRRPLFFIGSTPYARALIPYLGPDQPVYGLNIFGLYGATIVDAVDVHAVALQYAREIRATQPVGALRLCAYCADTKLAFAVADALVKGGSKIALLAFIDTIWTASGERRGVFLANLYEFGASFVAQKLRRRVNVMRDWVAAVMRKRRIARARKTGEQLPVRMHHHALIRSMFSALHVYTPQPFAGKITLFLSRELRMKYPEELDRVALGGIEIHEIPGFHDRVFAEPQINVLGEKLRVCLDRATD